MYKFKLKNTLKVFPCACLQFILHAAEKSSFSHQEHINIHRVASMIQLRRKMQHQMYQSRRDDYIMLQKG